MQKHIFATLVFLFGLHYSLLFAADPRTVDFPGTDMSLTLHDNGTKVLQWPRPPALELNRISAGSDITGLTAIPDVVRPYFIGGDSATFTYTFSNSLPREFYLIEQQQMSSNALLAANVMNRIAYGPTPDLQKRILTGPEAIGPQAYIDEQLNIHSLPADPIDSFSTVTTNAVPEENRLRTNWVKVTLEGYFSTGRMYVYLTEATAPGEEQYIDDIAIYRGVGENLDLSTNFVRNGDFESSLTGPWNVSANMAGSAITTEQAHTGNRSLRMVASSGGTTRTSSIWQDLSVEVNDLIGEDATLCFWYLPRTNSSIITVRLSGSGVRGSPVNEGDVVPVWVYVTQTGTATSDKIYLYLDRAGTAYIDDIKLVGGSVAEAGPNLLVNGDFESPLVQVPQSGWVIGMEPDGEAVASNSFVTPYVAFSGSSCLQLDFADRGTTEESAVVQYELPLTLGQTYTVSYWYAPGDPRLTVRLSGRGILSEPDTGIAAISRRLETNPEGSSLADLRAWYLQHCVGGGRQLLEVLTQFWENHFVTQHSKTVDYFDRYYDDFGLLDRIAAGLEYREISRWRAAMSNPNWTFHDLLVVHAESPAQIIYLDTVDSRGDMISGGPEHYVANENYARELLELFCTGVDNGYDQHDIVIMSRGWTGWRVEIKDDVNEDDPFAPASTALRVPGSGSTSNLVGTWTFHYRPDRHDDRQKVIFPGKTVADRFGPPWAGRSYELVLPARSGAEGINDGYEILQHLANLPYTMEFISVKLCRLFVHDDFVHGVYDYSHPETLSPEGKLILDCMKAWELGRGRMRLVLDTIFNSDLFRGHASVNQKVKTPLEFCVSTIRALRSELPDGTFTGSSDGYSIAGTSRTGSRSPISRMGLMRLFDRGDPDGYPETGPPWISAGTLAERLRFVQSTLMRDNDPDKDDDMEGSNNNHTDPVALLKNNLPVGQWRDSMALADYFTTLIFPGVGRGNLEDYRSAANTFLNRTEDGSQYSFFGSLAHTSTEYDTRVRGMVALLLSFQRFQEQ